MADPAELHRVGRFLVLEELGRGGMGVVLAAYDPDLDRKVAVKVLSAAPGSKPAERSEGRARLLREAQALARLSHPHVVTVHEVGTVGDQVFLAMELVRGPSLRQWVQQASGPGAWRSIVAMFRQAGEGLAAAHRAGLVHRDFKPENVIVDAEGRARVLDFGLARTGISEGEPLSVDTGPLDLAASERAPAERTRRLAGARAEERPPAAAELETTQLPACEPRELAPASADLETTQLPACEPAELAPAPVSLDTTQRPSSVDTESARRLSEPGPSQPPAGGSTTRRLRRAAGDLDTPLTEIGMVMGTPAYMAPEQYLGQRVDARSDQYAFCVALYEALYDERPFEAPTYEQLRSLVLTGAPPTPSNARDVPAWILRELLRGLRRDPAERHGSMDELLEALARDPGRRTRRVAGWGAAALAVVGAAWAYRAYVDQQLAEAREAGDPCSEAAARLQGIWDPERRKQIRRAFVDTKLGYATSTWQRVEARLDGYSERWGAAAQAICRATRVEHVQSDALLDVRQACLNSRLSELRAHTAVFARADGRVLEGAIEGIEGLRDPDECRTVESMHLELPLPADEEQAARAVTLRQRLDDVDALLNASQVDEPRTLAEAVVADAEALGYLPVIAEAQLALGRVHEHHGRYAEAEAAFERALWAAEVGRHDAAAVDAWGEWMRTVGYQQGRYELAHAMEPRFDAALHRLGPDVRREAKVHRVLGTLAFGERNYASAVSHLEKATALLEGEPNPDEGQLSRAYQNLGTALYRVRRLDESATMLSRAFELTTALYGPGHPRLAPTLQSLGNLARRRGDPVAAQRYFEQVIAIVEAVHPPTHPARADNYRNLGSALQDAGQLDEAITWFERALEADRQRGELEPPYNGSLALGVALFEAGRVDEAREPLELGVSGADAPGVDVERLAEARFALARILWEADPPARPRALALVTAAHESWLAQGNDSAREETEAWLAEHRVR